MPPPALEEALADRRYVTLILRLMLDQHGQLVRGELVDTTDVLLGRFIGVAGLNQTVAEWLTGREESERGGPGG